MIQVQYWCYPQLNVNTHRYILTEIDWVNEHFFCMKLVIITCILRWKFLHDLTLIWRCVKCYRFLCNVTSDIFRLVLFFPQENIYIGILCKSYCWPVISLTYALTTWHYVKFCCYEHQFLQCMKKLVGSVYQ